MRPVRLPIVLVVASSALAITACGSSAKPSGTAAASAGVGLTGARCMRAHGVSDFPDPRPDGGFSIHRAPGSATLVINGVTVGGPAYATAERACNVSGAIGPRPLTGAQEQMLIAKAHCIRTHGVPSFPDPSFGPDGMGVRTVLPPSFNPDSPAARRAAKACAGVGATIPGTGVG